MPKKLRNDPIYIAPDIYARLNNEYYPRAIDERNNRELDLLEIEDKILIYERQVQEWFLNKAKALIKRREYDFVVMMIATAYIEGVEQYRHGESSEGKSKKTFREGVKRIFELGGADNQKIDNLYAHLRCGLFHNGMSGDLIVLNRKLREPIVFMDDGIIKINPVRFLDTVVNDFSNYIHELNFAEDEELRRNFDRMFTVV